MPHPVVSRHRSGLPAALDVLEVDGRQLLPAPLDWGLDDAGGQAAHLGGQMLPFERLDDGPRPAGLEQGQARR